MSDEEELVYVKKQKTIHYGSLEDHERARLASLASKNSENDDGHPIGTSEGSSQIHVSNGNLMQFCNL